MHWIKEKCRFKECKVQVSLCYVTCYIIRNVTVMALSLCFMCKWDSKCVHQLLNMRPQIKCYVKTNSMWPKTADSWLLGICLRLDVENLILVSLTVSVARLVVLYFNYLWFEMKECSLCLPCYVYQQQLLRLKLWYNGKWSIVFKTFYVEHHFALSARDGKRNEFKFYRHLQVFWGVNVVAVVCSAIMFGIKQSAVSGLLRPKVDGITVVWNTRSWLTNDTV